VDAAAKVEDIILLSLIYYLMVIRIQFHTRRAEAAGLGRPGRGRRGGCGGVHCPRRRQGRRRHGGGARVGGGWPRLSYKMMI
jgi:hypothetical protein